MSTCPTCGRWWPDEIPFDIEKRLGPCPACKRLHGNAGDVSWNASSLGYVVECRQCGLSTGYFHDVEQAVQHWNAVAGFKEAKR